MEHRSKHPPRREIFNSICSHKHSVFAQAVFFLYSAQPGILHVRCATQTCAWYTQVLHVYAALNLQIPHNDKYAYTDSIYVLCKLNPPRREIFNSRSSHKCVNKPVEINVTLDHTIYDTLQLFKLHCARWRPLPKSTRSTSQYPIC